MDDVQLESIRMFQTVALAFLSAVTTIAMAYIGARWNVTRKRDKLSSPRSDPDNEMSGRPEG